MKEIKPKEQQKAQARNARPQASPVPFAPSALPLLFKFSRQR